MVWRCDCRAERVRWAEGGRVLRREKEPVVEVWRMEREPGGCWGGDEVEVGEVEAGEGLEGGEGKVGRRVRVVGKWPV